MNPTPPVSRRRKKLIGWSVGLAILCVVALASMFVIAPLVKDDSQAVAALGVIVTLFTLIPGIVGFALGLSSCDRRLKTPGIAWVGIIGNGLVVLIWVLLVIVGLTK